MTTEATVVARPRTATQRVATPAVVVTERSWRERLAPRALQAAAAAWFGVAWAGQWIFAAYVLVLYGRAAQGDGSGFNAVMQHGYIPGAWFLNAVVVAHVAVAFVVMAGGALQLLPAVRRRWPVFHRWNGRVYLTAVAVLCTAGLVMQATRANASGPLFLTSQSLNVAVVAACAWLAVRAARARRLDAHRRWALRLYLAASAAWFFRIVLMFWIVANQGPRWFDADTFSGPFITFLAFAQFLLPLAVLELYFRAQRGGTTAKLAMAGGLGALTLATLGGIGAATAIMWLPRL
jgi:uncharacterized membrane protein